MPVCPVCLASDAATLHQRDGVPVLQNVILQTREQSRAFPVGRLDIRQCHRCSFVFNAAFDPAALDYNADYNNSVQASGVYRAHQAQMAERVLSVPGRLCCIEVGCGEGEFLNVLADSGRLERAFGYDPAHKGLHPLAPVISVSRSYFGPETVADLPEGVNVVVSRHTIEHIPDPRDFISAIAGYVRQRDIPLFLETPDVSWIVANNAFEDFFYEHCSLFTPQAMRYLLAEFGLDCDIVPVYGGQYMWVTARRAAEPAATAPAVHRFPQEIAGWTEKVRALSQQGKVAIWGGASKGVTFSLLIEGIDCAIDLNSAKQGCYLPVSSLPIVSPQAAIARGVSSIIVMNPNYLGEIRDRLTDLGWRGQLLTLRHEQAA